MLIFLLAHADGRCAETKKASVVSHQLRLDGTEIKEIRMNDFSKFRVRHSARLSIDHQYLLHIRAAQALEQNPFPLPFRSRRL